LIVPMQMMRVQRQNISENLLQRVMELQCRREILQRWLASEVLTNGLEQSLHTMLGEVEEQLRALSARPGTFDGTLD
jgi:hypothetical protein